MQEIKVKLNNFLLVLDNPIPVSEYQLSERKRDMGLIISDTSEEKILDMIEKKDHWIVGHLFNFEQKVVEAIQLKKSLLVKISIEPESEFLSQLKEYSQRGMITSNDKENTLSFEKNIVCVISSQILEGIQFPYFKSLFGPILILND